MTFTVASVNVNGIRAAYRRDMENWITQSAPDVLLLQEVRADEATAIAHLGEQWHTYINPCRIKGRAGVGIAVRKELGPAVEVRTGVVPIENEPEVDSGRWLEADLKLDGHEVTIVSAYLHSGQVDSPKLDQKLAHLPLVGARLEQLMQRAQDGGPQALVCGDFNIVHTERDIKNWKGNHNKTSGVLDVEIAFLNEWFTDQGWTDIVRQLSGDVQGPYSWWSWRGKAFDNDAGWRIDYQIATPKLAQLARSFEIGRAQSYDLRFSDHAPLSVTFG